RDFRLVLGSRLALGIALRALGVLRCLGIALLALGIARVVLLVVGTARRLGRIGGVRVETIGLGAALLHPATLLLDRGPLLLRLGAALLGLLGLLLRVQSGTVRLQLGLARLQVTLPDGLLLCLGLLTQ